MANISYRIGRRTIFFSDHALDRYWQRFLDDDPHAGRNKARQILLSQLADATWERLPPPWARMSLWHKARCEGAVMLDRDRAFIINRNPSGDLVAVTFLDYQEQYACAT